MIKVEEESRVCKQCGIKKPIDQFHKSKVHHGGHIPLCAECKNWNHRSAEDKAKEETKWRLLAMSLRFCPHCNNIKGVNEFAPYGKRNDGLRAYCKECEQKINLDRSRTPEFKAKQTEYMLSPKYFEKLHERYRRNIDTKPDFKTALYLRNQLYNGITGYGAIKEADFMTMVGMTPVELNNYLESQFEKGMSWENHNRLGWHTDHIIPMKAFDMKNPLQQRASCFWKNLRPMWGRPNIQKGAKYNIEDFNNYMIWFKKYLEI